MNRIIGFVGYECEDIALYLAECLGAYGKKVAIEDRTEQGMLLRMLEVEQRRTSGEEKNQLDYLGIVISALPVRQEKFDFIFLLFGYRLQHPKLYDCEVLFMVTDDLPAHAALLGKIEPWERKQALLIRNHMGTGHKSDYLEFLSNQKVERRFCLSWDEKDIVMRCRLGNENESALTEVSTGMKEMLKELLRFLLPEITEDFLKRIGKCGRKGVEGWGK